MIQFLLNLGVLTVDAPYLQQRIRMANALGLIIGLGVGLPFTLISLFYFPPLTFVPALGVIVSLGSIGLNYGGLIHLGRIVITLLPMVLAGVYHAGLAVAGEAPVVGIYLIEMSFSVLGFLTFDWREKRYVLFTIGLSALIIISFPWTSSWWELPLDTAVIRTGWLGNVSVLLSLLVAFGGLFVLMNQNRIAQQTTDELLTQAAITAQRMATSEQALQMNLDQLHQTHAEEKKRQWSSEGIAQVNHLLRQHEQIVTLSDQLLAFLVRYMGVNQGALFIAADQAGEAMLEMAACYGYSRKKYLQKRVAIGQGLLGQAYLEKAHMYLTDIPADYLKITSGLGGATPSAVLIVPCLNNEAVEAIFELASFRPFSPHEITFLQQVGESLAMTLRTVRVNEQTRNLLSVSQQQAETMRAQEEAMRQAMEEMSATQEEMRRKEKTLVELLTESQHKEMHMQQQEQMLRASMEELAALQQALFAKDQTQRQEIAHLRQVQAAKQAELEELVREMQVNEQDMQQQEAKYRQLMITVQTQAIELEEKNALIRQLEANVNT